MQYIYVYSFKCIYKFDNTQAHRGMNFIGRRRRRRKRYSVSKLSIPWSAILDQVNDVFSCKPLVHVLCLIMSPFQRSGEGGHIVLRCSLFLDIHFMYMLVRDGTFFIFPLKLMIFGILLHRLRRRATYHHDPHLTLTFNIIVELFSFKFQVSLSGHVLQRFVRPFIEIVNHYCKR